MIDNDILERVLAEGLRTGADFAEVFASDWRGTGVGLDDGKIEQLSTGRNRGAGIRVIAGDTTGFAHTADLSESGLMAAARVAAEAARQGGGGTKVIALTMGVDGIPTTADGRAGIAMEALLPAAGGQGWRSGGCRTAWWWWAVRDKGSPAGRTGRAA